MLSLKSSYRFRKTLLCVTTVGFWVLALLVLSIYPTFVANSTFADDDYPVTPTLSISSSGVLNFDLHPGEFNSGTQEVTVNTSNYTGYTVTISAEGSTDLVNLENAQKVIPTLTLDAGQESKTSEEFSSTSYGISTNGIDFKPAISGGIVKTSELSGSDTFDLTFGAKVYTDLPSGDYRKTFTLTAIANDALYAIYYEKNTEDDVTNMPDPNPQPGSTSGSSVTLSTAVPVRSRYEFLGWDTNSAALTPTYTIGDSLTLDKKTDNETTLYAIWEHTSETFNLEYNSNGGTGNIGTDSNTNRDGEYTFTITDEAPTRTHYQLLGWSTIPTADRPEYHAGDTISRFTPGTTTLYAIWGYGNDTLQGWRSCSSLGTGASVSLLDARDGKSYTVKKLADGNCWMTDNLRLDFSDITEEISYRNTNNPELSFVDEMNDSPASSNDFTEGTDNELRYNSSNLGDDTLDSEGHTYEEYGVYYNWHTATAGNGTTDTVNSEAGGDLCPKGWHLPSGTAEGEYYNLNYAINGSNRTDAVASANLRDATNNFTNSGRASDNQITTRGTNGYYWTSTAQTVAQAHTLSFGATSANPGTDSAKKTEGRTVRCLSGTQFTLRYDEKGGSVTIGKEIVMSEEDEHDFVISETPSRKTGYYFLGWSTNPDATVADYQPGDTITVTSSITVLYAVWEEATIIPASEFQCSSLANVGDTAFVRDVRDNSIYTVNKLADEQCWMTDNLRLDFSNLVQPISASNTNNPTADFIAAANLSPVSSSSFKSSNRQSLNYNTDNIGSTTIASTGHTYDHFGVYYNWYTATAGNGTTSIMSGEAGGDICPKGWHLPSGGSDGDFINLNYAINGNLTNATASANLRKAPNNFLYSGRYSGTSAVGLDTGGQFWASTASASLNANGLTIAPNSVSAGTNSIDKYTGRALRCIQGTEYSLRYDSRGGNFTPDYQAVSSESGSAEFTINNRAVRHSGYYFLGWSTNPDATVADYQPGDTITVTSSITVLYAVWEEATIIPASEFQCSSLANVGDTAFVRDVRDNSIYTVNKLADEQCWMTDNLRLDFSNLVQPISASNTNNPTADFIAAAPNAVSSSSWCTNNQDSTCTDKILFNSSNIGVSTFDSDGHTYDEYGVYYNWYTATAGNGTTSIMSGEAGGDICPKGWRLPYGDGDGDFNTLISALPGASISTSLRTEPNNFVHSGYFYNSSSSERNTVGYYWTQTADQNASEPKAINLYLSTSNATANVSQVRYLGFNIRCIADT